MIELLKEVDDECETCEQYTKARLRPVVGLPLATHFNEVVCMDLNEYTHHKVWILYLIDATTRYTAATLIKTKKEAEVIKRVFAIWITYFGSPVKFLSDKGGKFAN